MLPDTCKDSSLYLGVELGQSRDQAAIVSLRKSNWETGARDPYDFSRKIVSRLEVLQVERFPTTASHATIAARVAQMSRGYARDASITIVADVTMSGPAFLEILHRQNLGPCRAIAVSVTGAEAEAHQNNCYYVPKHELINGLVDSCERDTLRVPAHLPAMESLLEALFGVRSKHGAARSGTPGAGDDEIVLALALANWRARKSNFYS